MRDVRNRSPIQGRTRCRVPVRRPARAIPLLHEGDPSSRGTDGTGFAFDSHLSGVAVRRQETVTEFSTPTGQALSTSPTTEPLEPHSSFRCRLVYFVVTRPRWYKPFYPCYVVADDPVAREVLVTKGAMEGPMDDREPVLSEIRSSAATPYSRCVSVCTGSLRPPAHSSLRSQCTISGLKESSSPCGAHPRRRGCLRRASHNERFELVRNPPQGFRREPSGCDP